MAVVDGVKAIGEGLFYVFAVVGLMNVVAMSLLLHKSISSAQYSQVVYLNTLLVHVFRFRAIFAAILGFLFVFCTTTIGVVFFHITGLVRFPFGHRLQATLCVMLLSVAVTTFFSHSFSDQSYDPSFSQYQLEFHFLIITYMSAWFLMPFRLLFGKPKFPRVKSSDVVKATFCY